MGDFDSDYQYQIASASQVAPIEDDRVTDLHSARGPKGAPALSRVGRVGRVAAGAWPAMADSDPRAWRRTSGDASSIIATSRGT